MALSPASLQATVIAKGTVGLIEPGHCSCVCCQRLHVKKGCVLSVNTVGGRWESSVRSRLGAGQKSNLAERKAIW